MPYILNLLICCVISSILAVSSSVTHLVLKVIKVLLISYYKAMGGFFDEVLVWAILTGKLRMGTNSIIFQIN